MTTVLLNALHAATKIVGVVAVPAHVLTIRALLRTNPAAIEDTL